jgi:hypothetical protein
MFLASTPSHKPIAVFDHIEDAEAYLCSVNDVSLSQAHSEPLVMNSDMFKIHLTEDSAERILGYILCGVKINPNYVVR